MSLSDVLSSEPYPAFPAGLDPEMERFLRGQYEYLRRLFAKFTATNLVNMLQAEMPDHSLPDVPDTGKDYGLVHEGGVGVKWSELTTFTTIGDVYGFSITL